MPPGRVDAISGRLRGAARAAGFAGLTLGMLGVNETHAALAPARRAELLREYRRTWIRAVMRIFAVELTVAGDAAYTSERGRLVVANHRSGLDIAVLFSLFDGVILSRGDLAKWPLIGLGAQRIGTLFVDRAQGASRAGAIRAMRRRLSERGTVIVFPEGTTFSDDEVRPFHAGAFAAARGLDVEVVPVGLAYEPGAEFADETFGAHLARVAGRPRTAVAARVGVPRALGAGQAAAHGEALRDEVQALVRDARAALGGRAQSGR